MTIFGDIRPENDEIGESLKDGQNGQIGIAGITPERAA
jgi:hypothetical protein